MNTIQIKRIYDKPSEEDGYRILVDRLWPRGFSKDRAQIDEWAKDVTPSTELRKEFHSEIINLVLFSEKYRAELDNNEKAYIFKEHIRKKLQNSNVTLIYAAKDREINHATLLKTWIEEHL